MNFQEGKNDELRARFTKWMEVTMYRARIDYLKKQNSKKRDVYIDDVIDEITYRLCKTSDTSSVILKQNSFKFTNDSVEDAFENLSKIERQVLIKLYAEDKKIKEVAGELGYSLSHTYRIKDAALNNLKKMLGGK